MELNKKNTFKIILIMFSTVAFYIGLTHINNVWAAIHKILGIFTPIILGLIIAFLLSPLVTALESFLINPLTKRYHEKGRTVSRAFGIVMSIVVVGGFIALLFLLVVPEVQEAFSIISTTLPETISTLTDIINGIFERYAIAYRIPSVWTDLFDTIKSYIENAFENGALNDIANTARSLISGVVRFLLGLVLSIYVLMKKEKISRFITRVIKAYCDEKTYTQIFRIVHISKISFRNYVTSQLTEAMILGILCFIGMLIFRFPYPTAASAVIGVTALIPVFGAWLGGILGTLLALSESPAKALLFIAFLVTLQQFETNVIYPRVAGKTMGLPGILIIISVILGAGIAGLLGMILAVPICSILYVLITESVENRDIKKTAVKDLEELGIVPKEDSK